jgi:hypothetical protein
MGLTLADAVNLRSILTLENDMIAIQTKYLGPTNSRGSRIKAWTDSGFSVTISYPYAHSYELSHFQAVKALIEKHKLDWDLTDMRYGGTEDGYVFCFAHSIVKE